MTQYTEMLDISQVKKRTGYRSTQSIYTLMERKQFPRPISVGRRTKRWIAAEIEGWIQAQIKLTRG